MGLLRYCVATSLDGFIAGPNGEYDWIVHDPTVDFAALFAEFDVFIMGRRTFELVQSMGRANPGKGQKTIVVSTTLEGPNIPGVEVVRDSVKERIAAAKQSAQKDLWLFGGGKLFRSLLDYELVDRIELSVMPVLLGQGIPLIDSGRQHVLQLISCEARPSGITRLVYTPIQRG